MIEVAEKERERERERERTKKTANVNAFLYGSYSHNKISVKHSLKIRPDFAQQLFGEVFVFRSNPITQISFGKSKEIEERNLILCNSRGQFSDSQLLTRNIWCRSES
jgi:hypothetical protein